MTGGELPALVVIDAVIRLLPGAIDDAVDRRGVVQRRPPGVPAIHAATVVPRHGRATDPDVGRPRRGGCVAPGARARADPRAPAGSAARGPLSESAEAEAPVGVACTYRSLNGRRPWQGQIACMTCTRTQQRVDPSHRLDPASPPARRKHRTTWIGSFSYTVHPVHARSRGRCVRHVHTERLARAWSSHPPDPGGEQDPVLYSAVGRPPRGHLPIARPAVSAANDQGTAA